MPRDRATLLTDLADDALIVRCDVCRRSGRYSVARLLAQHGDLRLTDLRLTRRAHRRVPEADRRPLHRYVQGAFRLQRGVMVVGSFGMRSAMASLKSN
jgi:hypothetical protein